jgi:hypothetical protein
MSGVLVSSSPHLPALPYGELVVPLLVAQEGERAAKRYIEFFAANIRNPNTRRAYARAATDFLGWCEQRGLSLPAIEPVHVAAYVEQLLQVGVSRSPGEAPAPLAAPSVKQQLAAVRMLFDWFVVGQVVPHNPASSVRGPKHVVSRGKTPVLPREDAKALIDAIETDTLIGLRDRALIGTLLGTVKLLAFGRASWPVTAVTSRQSSCRSGPADIGPHFERTQPCSAILTGSDVVAVEMEEVGDLIVGREKTLCLPR